jgi:hypothetical protein
MLLFLRPLSATLAYIPGPSVPMAVPLKFSSSKNSQVPERMTSEEMGGEDETCKILAQGVDLSRSRREPEFFRDRWRHTIKAQFVMAEAVYVFRFIG